MSTSPSTARGENGSATNASLPAVTPPKHIPIPEEVLTNFTIGELKLELQARKVPLKGLNKKEKFQARLREALERRLPVYSMAVLAEEAKRAGKSPPSVVNTSSIML